ncbi:hypothetical protein [Methylomonas sp. MgM2]
MRTFCSQLIFILMLCTFGQAEASVPLGGNRKGAGGSYDMYGCMLTNDYYAVNFAAYQIDPNQAQDGKQPLPEAECVDMPIAGKTQISIDLLDLDVRKKPVALKILREDGQTVAELPMAVAKQGVLSTSVDFKTPGKYKAVLYVDDTDLHMPLEISALHIPLTVGIASEQSEGGSGGLLILFALTGAVIAISAYYVPRLLKPNRVETA